MINIFVVVLFPHMKIIAMWNPNVNDSKYIHVDIVQSLFVVVIG